MISKRLRNLFLVSLLLIYAHGVEEILGGFQYSDSFMIFGAAIFQTTPEDFYWASHIIWWISVPALFLLLNTSKWILPLLTLYGAVFFVEIHHIIKSIIAASYYPGMITAAFYPILGYFYWSELISNFRKNIKKT